VLKNRPVYSRVAVVYNPDKERAKEEWLKLQRWLKARHLSVAGGPKVTSEMKDAGFVIALGGDGTVLRVARDVYGWNVPVLGVNVGRLGFLAATEVGATYRTLTRILAGQGRIENRSLLSVSAVIGGKKWGPFVALNECVVRSGATGRILILNVTINGQQLASYVGDGLIVSTPTGSTAYNLAASGPIVHPDVNVHLLCPICPHSLFQRPLVVPTTEQIQIHVEGPAAPAVLSLDGQLNHTLASGDRVDIRQASERVALLMDPDRNFYQVLQSKLKWGGS
jgi:NAD+ kinase